MRFAYRPICLYHYDANSFSWIPSVVACRISGDGEHGKQSERLVGAVSERNVEAGTRFSSSIAVATEHQDLNRPNSGARRFPETIEETQIKPDLMDGVVHSNGQEIAGKPSGVPTLGKPWLGAGTAYIIGRIR